LRVIVHSAGMQDRDGAALVLDKIRQRFPWLKLVWADAGYNARQVKDAVARSPGLRLEIVKRTDDRKGFVVLPRRWVVERTFSWFGRNRRLAKDYENLAETLTAFVTLAAIQFYPLVFASGALTDWLSTTPPVGLASRPTRSRSSISATSWIV
jgi:transposase